MLSKSRNSDRVRAVMLILAGITAGSLLSGPAIAHTGRKIAHLTKHLDPLYLNENQKAADANQLDGLDSTQFLRSNGKAADADLLDGISSAGFLTAAGKAVDADKLDNIDSAAFVQFASTLTGVRSCPGPGFDPESGATDYVTGNDGERFVAGGDTFRCSVDLPNGATVTGVSFTVNDTPTAGVVSGCALYRTDLTVAVANEDTVNTPPAATVNGSGAQTVTGAIIPANAVINNNSFAYSFGCDLGDDAGIYGATVTYTVPASAG